MLRRAVPILVMVLVTIAVFYPVALFFGLPLAKRDMEDQRKWLRETVTALPPRTAPATAGLDELEFAADPDSGVLILGSTPARADATGPLLTWGAELNAEAPGVFRSTAPQDEEADLVLYASGPDVAERCSGDWCLLTQGAVPPAQPPDGRRSEFVFGVADGPVLLENEVLQEGTDYTLEGARVVFTTLPPFDSDLRRISADYAVLDSEAGLIALHDAVHEAASADSLELRFATDTVRLAPQLSGAVDGENRAFTFPAGNLIESERDRRVFLDGVPLSDTAERPAERVDGVTGSFTFESSSGLITQDGNLLEEGAHYTRAGNVIAFESVPARNAQLRQYQDYRITDAQAGTVLLTAAPAPGQQLYTDRFSRYSQPACGNTVQECFLALPQHPVPFPHWIAQRIAPFFAKYPLGDERNVLRATLYTTAGTLAALGLGGAVGMLLAVLFVLFRPLERALLPWTIASQTIPIIALVPVLLLVLGNFGITIQTSLLPTALVGAYICFFPVVVSTVKGLRAVEPLILDLMKSYAARPLTIFWKVRFPAAVPFFFTGLKLGIAAALVGALVAETESNNRRGLGYQVLGQVQSGNVADVWILLLISGALGILLVTLIGFLQRTLAPWDQTG